jgi:hypothetical protein
MWSPLERQMCIFESVQGIVLASDEGSGHVKGSKRTFTSANDKTFACAAKGGADDEVFLCVAFKAANHVARVNVHEFDFIGIHADQHMS